MKKLKTIAMFMLLMLTCVGFAACSDDEESSGDYASMIIGTWTEGGEYSDYGYTFKADGTFIAFGSGEYHGRYEIKNGYLTLIDYVYDDYEVYQIKSITKTKMVLYVDDEYEDFVLYRAN